MSRNAVVLGEDDSDDEPIRQQVKPGSARNRGVSGVDLMRNVREVYTSIPANMPVAAVVVEPPGPTKMSAIDGEDEGSDEETVPQPLNSHPPIPPPISHVEAKKEDDQRKLENLLEWEDSGPQLKRKIHEAELASDRKQVLAASQFRTITRPLIPHHVHLPTASSASREKSPRSHPMYTDVLETAIAVMDSTFDTSCAVGSSLSSLSVALQLTLSQTTRHVECGTSVCKELCDAIECMVKARPFVVNVNERKT